MGSYTDTPLTANSFRPYVQQIPVEAETSVGLQKQRQYDEGYQRIQSQIDKVAGLSIIKDVDKQYLQSKMNELGNNLRMVSMGDFSNYQLVNSVGGMVNQVGKDPFIQAAVMSTANINKGNSDIETARKAGKSDKNNEAYYYEKSVAPYMNAGLKDANGKPIIFNGSFSPYVDITDEVRKLAKEAGVDESVLQQMYSTDVNGKIQFAPDGSALPARTMTEVTSSSNAKAIEGILHTVLNRGDIQNQIGIDAWANTRGVDPTKMLSSYEQKFNDSFLIIDQEKVRFNTLLSGKISDEQKKQIEEGIKNLDKQKDKYKTQLAELTSLATTDPQRFKETMYKNNYENSLRDIFTKTKREEKNLASPLRQQLNWEEKYKFEVSNEMFDRGMANKEFDLKLVEFDAKYPIGKDGKRHPAKTGKGDGEDGSGGGNGTTAAVSGTTGKTATEMNDEETASLFRDTYNTGFEVMYEMFNKSDKTQKRTKNEFQQYINTLAKAQNVTPEEFVTTWLGDVERESRQMGVSLSGYDQKLLTKFKNLHSDYLDKLAVTATIDKQVRDNNPINPSDYLADVVPPKGFTKQDMLDYLFYDYDPSMKSRVDAKWGNRQALLTAISTAAVGDPTNYSTSPSVGGSTSGLLREQQITKNPVMESITRVNDKVLSTFSKMRKEKEEILRKITMTDEARSLPFGESDKEKKATKARVHAFISGNPELKDRTDMLTALESTDSGGAIIINKPFSEGQPFTGDVVITHKGKEYRVKIENQEDLQVVTGRDDFEEFKANPFVARAITGETHSTNLGSHTNKPNAWHTAYISPDVTPLLKNSDKYIPLGADFNLMPDEKTWTVTIYLKSKETGEVMKPMELNGEYVVGAEDSIITALNTLTEPQIDQIIKNRQK